MIGTGRNILNIIGGFLKNLEGTLEEVPTFIIAGMLRQVADELDGNFDPRSKMENLEKLFNKLKDMMED